MKTYRVVYELDESGHWIAAVPSVKGCHTYGRSIRQARDRIREALALFVRDAARVRLVDDVRLPADVRRRGAPGALPPAGPAAARAGVVRR